MTGQTPISEYDFCNQVAAFCCYDSRADNEPMVGNVFFSIGRETFMVADMMYPPGLLHCYCNHPEIIIKSSLFLLPTEVIEE